MAEFSKEQQPKKRGRPAGSKNKRAIISSELHESALTQITAAVKEGEQWAIIEVLKRTMPPLKAVTPEMSLDAEALRTNIDLNNFKIKEMSDFEDRLQELEQIAAGSK